MKKICIVLLIMLVLLSGCVVDPEAYYFDADEIESATAIQLVSYTNYNPTEIRVYEDTVLRFDISNVIVINQLEKDKFRSFAQDLSTIVFHVENISVDEPIGYALLIYINKKIIVLSCTSGIDYGYSMVASFDEKGNFIEHIACFADKNSYDDRILKKYFGV